MKRTFDLIVAILILAVILIPLILISILLLIFNNGSGVFFTQIRTGKNAKLFRIIKFKTMSDERDENGLLLPDEKRLTPIGRFVRSTSIDELPQLLNVIKGDMSLVGPRPLLEKYIPKYSIEQFRRHDVKPGITGWAQVNGRNNISWEKKFELDLYYIENYSFLLDFKIICMTLIKVFMRSDISKNGYVTTNPFDGKN